jgi:hypothetical protein
LTYDSTKDTEDHAREVDKLIGSIVVRLKHRAATHDASKLSPPEKEFFDFFSPKLSGVTYGSDEYKEMLNCLKPALRHHYAENRHHPEHFKGGVNGMTLVDLIEMLCDWKAATLRHDDGSMKRSLEHNKGRFGLGTRLTRILENTCVDMGWVEKKEEVQG